MEKQSEVTEVKSTTDPTNTLTDKISQLDLYNPDNLSPKIESFPSVLIQPPLSPVPNYSDSFVSITSSSLLKQTFISGTRYPDNSASLGEALKMLRELQGLSQNDLAALSGISQSNLSALESNARQMGRDRALTLAKALHVHPAVLLFPDFNIADVA